MKAITIYEPWASMIANGEKTIEVRSWRTKHRGHILLCAGKKVDGPLSGNAFAIANITNVRKLKKSDSKNTGGIYCPNCFGWILSDIKNIEPFRVLGKPGIFNVNVEQ